MKYIVETPKSVEQAVANLQAAVQGHQFGVLHIHNLQETLKKKGVDFPNACMPASEKVWWRSVGVVIERQPIWIGDLNPWDHTWIRLPEPWVRLPHPSYPSQLGLNPTFVQPWAMNM